MTPLEQIAVAIEDLIARGVRRTTAAPHLYRLLWRLGFAVPPPLYQSFLGLMVLQGSPFGLVLGAALAMADRRLAPDGATVLGIAGGAAVGLLMAGYFQFRARRLGLLSWAEYLSGPDPDDAGW